MKNKISKAMKKLMMLLIISLIMFTGIVGAVPVTEWTKTFDLANSCDDLPDCVEKNTFAESVQQTRDGGYIFGGYRHYLSQPPEPSIVDKVNSVLVKTDKNGNKLWAKILNVAGNAQNRAYSVNQTSDGGYILAGTLGPLHHTDGALLIKTDASGNKVWEKRFIGTTVAATHGDVFYSVQQTRDGGYIAAGTTFISTGGSTAFHAAWLVKTSASGSKVWEKKFGGSSDRIIQSVQQTADGGYILAGRKEQSSSTNDVLVIKTDASGNKIWERVFTGIRDDQAFGIQQIKGGGYIVAGHTYSPGTGSEDMWLIKLDSGGNRIWSKTFGGSAADGARSVQQTSDGGYILSGYKGSNGWLLKTDTNGNKIWDKTYGTGILESVKQTKYGGYITGGYNRATYPDTVALLVKLGTDTPAANLLKNPGFEVASGSLPQYWTKSQTGTMATFTYPAPGRVGGKAVAIRYATKETGKVALWQQTVVPIVPGAIYKLSGYMKLEGVTGTTGGGVIRLNGASLRINWYDAGGNIARINVITRSGTSGWTKYEETIVAPDNAVRASVGGDLFNAAGKVTFDDLSFMKVS